MNGNVHLCLHFECRPIRVYHDSKSKRGPNQNPPYMPYINVYIHFVWCTKNREPYLESPETRKSLWEHMKENALKKNIFVDCINGYKEHCHCIISLKHDQTMSKIMQLLKGESSY
jgi:putative transposase